MELSRIQKLAFSCALMGFPILETFHIKAGPVFHHLLHFDHGEWPLGILVLLLAVVALRLGNNLERVVPLKYSIK